MKHYLVLLSAAALANASLFHHVKHVAGKVANTTAHVTGKVADASAHAGSKAAQEVARQAAAHKDQLVEVAKDVAVDYVIPNVPGGQIAIEVTSDVLEAINKQATWVTAFSQFALKSWPAWNWRRRPSKDDVEAEVGEGLDEVVSPDDRDDITEKFTGRVDKFKKRNGDDARAAADEVSRRAGEIAEKVRGEAERIEKDVGERAGERPTKLRGWREDLKNKVKEEVAKKVDEKVGDHEARVETAVEILEERLNDEHKQQIAAKIDEIDAVISIQTVVDGDSSVENAADALLDKVSRGHLSYDTVDEVAQSIDN